MQISRTFCARTVKERKNGIIGSVDKWNSLPSQCTCLFVEGIWISAQCVNVKVCMVVCQFPALTLSMFPLPFKSLFSLPSLHLSFLLLMCVHVHLPIWVCDSCSLFVYIVSGLHIYKDNRFTMNPTLNASPHLSSSKFLSCFFHFGHGHFHTIKIVKKVTEILCGG